MKLDIRDNIPPDVALTCVLEVVKNGKISEGEHVDILPRLKRVGFLDDLS